MSISYLISTCLVGLAWGSHYDVNLQYRAAQPANPPPLSCSAAGENAGVRCNTRGFVSFIEDAFCGDNQNTTQITPDFDTCRNLCEGRASANLRTDALGHTCASFGYNTVTGLCTFTCLNLAQQNLTADLRSNTIYSHQLCYACKPRTCPSPAGVNLLDNGGFEDNAQLYGPWGPFRESSSLTLVSPGHNSKNAVRINVTGPETGKGLHQSFYTCRRQLYVFSLDYMIQSVKPSNHARFPYFQLQAEHQSSSDFRNDIRLVPTPGTWQTTQLYFYGGIFGPQQYSYEPSPLLASVGFTYNSNTGAAIKVLVDNISVLPMSSSPKAGAVSLLQNGGIESGSLEPWTFKKVGKSINNYLRPDFVGVVLPGINSRHGLQIRKADPNGDSLGFDRVAGQLIQDFVAVAGTAYVVHAEYRGVKHDPDERLQTQLYTDFQLFGFPDAARQGAASSSIFFDGYPGQQDPPSFPTTGVVQIQYVFVATHHYMRFQFDFDFVVTDIAVNVTLDNFSIVQMS